MKSRPLFVAVLKVCGVSDAGLVKLWLQALERVRGTPGHRAVGPEPYRGLASFQIEDSEWFFGRQILTDKLIARLADLHTAGGGLQVVVGASGSGKSSLLRAGLVPLQAGKAPGSAAWPVVLFTPGSRPMDELATRLSARTGFPAGKVAEAIGQIPAGAPNTPGRSLPQMVT
jgi:conflict system STAND superfamily ATPase